MLFQADCLDWLPTVPDKSIDLVIIDPPYNIGKDHWDNIGYTAKGYQPKPFEGEDYHEWMARVLVELARVLKDSGSLWVFHNDFRAMARFMADVEAQTDMELRDFIVWNKLFPGARQEGFLRGFLEVEGLNHFQKMAEYILFFTKRDLHKKLREIRLAKGVKSTDISAEIPSRTGGLTGWYSNVETGKNYPTEKTIVPITKYLGVTMDQLVPKFRNQKTHHSVWNYEFDGDKYEHLTPKPIELLKNIIAHCSDPGDVVLDCFGGSGSTGIAAALLDRRYILVEQEPEYIDLIRRRFEAEVPLPHELGPAIADEESAG